MNSYDVIVVGGGNAALCAAISARHHALKVLLLERAPKHMRGGNTRHTRNIRYARNADAHCPQPYSDKEFFDDLMAVSGDPANVELAKYTIRESRALPEWMGRHGISWQPPLAGTLHLGRTNGWFLGGGKALVNSYCSVATRMGIEFRYNSCVEDILIEDSRFQGVRVECEGRQELIFGNAVVVASGGFEANIEWLKRFWGNAAENFCVRGTPFNDGKILGLLLEKGVMPIGNPKSFHAVAVDARAPKYDGGIVTRLDAIPFGIVVNHAGKRFYDEGEEIWPKRYAIWGGLIAEQPNQTAFVIVDSKTINSFIPPIYKPYKSDTIRGLAASLQLEPDALELTVREYNRATFGNVAFSPDRLDGLKTNGLGIPKSNWALPLDRPPFFGLPLKPGITFTYMGVAVDGAARVLKLDGTPLKNIYAAGEIMAGNILTKGYLAGFGMTIGSVFGRLAGKEAAINATAGAR